MTRPDLRATALATTPAAPIRAPATSFSATVSTNNAGSVASGAPTTRYYLSLDGAKGWVTGTRVVPTLAPGATHSGTVTVTIPTNTPPSTYVVLACADDLNGVPETNDGNNCRASTTPVTVTP